MSPSILTRFVCLALAAVCLGEAAPAQAPRAPRIVVLYDERLDLPGLAILDAQIIQTLTREARGPVGMYREVMGHSRFRTASSLPARTTVLYSDRASWKRYRILIAATVGVLVLQLALIFLLLAERRTRRGAELALRESERRAERVAAEQ